MVKITSYYGNSPSAENNAKMITIGKVSLFFSYETLVGIDTGDANPTIVHANDWGPTTGKHCNAIDGGTAEAKARRLSDEEFQEYVKALDIQVNFNADAIKVVTSPLIDTEGEPVI